MTQFSFDDYKHTAKLLRSGNESVVRATLSNNLNIIISALDIAAGVAEASGDTWECPTCGHSEPWWTESNAWYYVKHQIQTVAAPVAKDRRRRA